MRRIEITRPGDASIADQLSEMRAWLRNWIATAQRHPSALLLFVQLLGVVLYPVMEDTQAGRALFGAFGIVVLALALWVVNRSSLLNWVAWILALPAVVLSIVAAVTSTCDGVACRGAITLTRVVMVWSPNRNLFVGLDCGRSAIACSRVPKNSAWLGQTVAHIGFFPIDVRS